MDYVSGKFVCQRIHLLPNSFMVRHTAKWLQHSLVVPGEEPIAVSWKVLCFADSTIWWAVAGMFYSFLGSARQSRIDVSRVLKEHDTDLRMWLASLGMEYDLMMQLSHRQLKFRGGASQAHACPDTLCTTWGIIVVLGHWAAHRRRFACRARARGLLEMFLGRLVEPSTAEDMSKLSPNLEAHALCGLPDIECRHWIGVKKSLGGGNHALQVLIDLIVGLCKTAIFCNAGARLLKHIIVELATHMDTRLSTGTVELDTDALKHASAVDHRGKRVHVDSDYKAVLKKRIIGQRKCSGEACIASLDDVRGATVQDWMHKDMRCWLAALWRIFSSPSSSGVFILKEDGARLGQPAREMMHYTLRFPRDDVACCLIPQAAGC